MFISQQVNGNANKNGDLESGKVSAEGATIKSNDDETIRESFKRSLRFYVRRIVVMLFILALLAVIAAINYYYLGLLWMIYTLTQIIVFTLFVYLIVTKKYKWFYIALVTAPRDVL